MKYVVVGTSHFGYEAVQTILKNEPNAEIHLYERGAGAPYAPPAMLDTKQIAAALSGLKPKPTRIAAVIATGAPNPAAPSKKALKENPINSTCILLSGEIEAILSFIISKHPIFTVSL